MKRHRLVFENLEPRNLFAYGDIDPTFAGVGKIEYSQEVAKPFDDTLNVAEQSSDQGVWLAGTSHGLGIIAKLDSTGELDAHFGTDGKKYLQIANAESTNVKSIRSQSDGTLLIAGILHYTNREQPFVAKLASDGKLDATFGDSGIWQGKAGTALNFIKSQSGNILLTETESIYVKSNPQATTFRVLKLTPNGTLDTQFGINGGTPLVSIPPVTFQLPFRLEFAVEGADSITFGFIQPELNDGRSFRSYRYTANGQVDSTFGVNGVAKINYQASYSGNWLQLSRDEFFVGARETFPETRVLFQKVNLLSGLVTSFGDGGSLVLPAPADAQHYGPDVVVLERWEGNQVRAEWVRALSAVPYATTVLVTESGQLNPNYGTHGVKDLFLGGAVGLIPSLVHFGSSTLVIGNAEFPRDFVLVAVDSQGNLDKQFSQDGKTAIDFSLFRTRLTDLGLVDQGMGQVTLVDSPELVGDLAEGGFIRKDFLGNTLASGIIPRDLSSNVLTASYSTSSGSTLIAQHGYLNGAYVIRIDRYLPNGQRDITSRMEFQASYWVDRMEFIPTEDGNVMLFADSYGGQSDGIAFATLVKLNSDGRLVDSFADHGVKRFPILNNRVADVVMVPGGMRLILSNTSAVDYFDKMFMMALDNNADTISSFGNNGVMEVLADHNIKLFGDAVRQGDGILVVMNFEGVYKLVRFNDHGIDLAFGDHGFKTLSLTPNPRKELTRIKASYNSFVIATTSPGPNTKLEIAVVDQQGNPVGEFGGDGQVEIDYSPWDDRLTSLIPLVDGSILVGFETMDEQGDKGVVLRLGEPINNPRPWHHLVQPLNTSVKLGDSIITPLDALLVINYLNSSNSGTKSPPQDYIDCNGDGNITPLDALLVINFLNSRSGSGEGESNEVEVGLGVSLDAFVADPSFLEQFAEDRRKARK